MPYAVQSSTGYQTLHTLLLQDLGLIHHPR